jgi:hypothetical protein
LLQDTLNWIKSLEWLLALGLKSSKNNAQPLHEVRLKDVAVEKVYYWNVGKVAVVQQTLK